MKCALRYRIVVLVTAGDPTDLLPHRASKERGLPIERLAGPSAAAVLPTAPNDRGVFSPRRVDHWHGHVRAHPVHAGQVEQRAERRDGFLLATVISILLRGTLQAVGTD